MKKLLYFLLFFVAFYNGCIAVMTEQKEDSSTRLRDFKKLYFVLKTPTESIPILPDSCNRGTPRIDPSLSIACEMAENLANIGFEFVATKKDSDAVANFSIAEIRWDALTGWITNNVFLIIEKTSTGEVIYGVRGDRIFITPGANTYVDNITNAVKKAY